jgi:hypothetical protein
MGDSTRGCGFGRLRFNRALKSFGRRGARLKKKRRNWDDARWTPFERIEPPVAGDLPNNQLWAEEGLAKWFANSIYVVRLIAIRAPAPFGVVVCLTVRTHDHQPRHWNGKAVKMLRGECRRHGHVVLVAAKEDLEGVEREEPSAASRQASGSDVPGPE